MIVRLTRTIKQLLLILFCGWVALLHIVLVLALIGFVLSFGVCQSPLNVS